MGWDGEGEDAISCKKDPAKSKQSCTNKELSVQHVVVILLEKESRQ
jgi:hypothetical protein